MRLAVRPVIDDAVPERRHLRHERRAVVDPVRVERAPRVAGLAGRARLRELALDEALAEIKEGAVDVDYENRSGQDVTNIYVDLQSQLRAKQAAEQQAGYDAAYQEGAAAATAAPAAPAPSAGGIDMQQLKQLGELHDAGVLSDEEFAAAKAKVLGGG